jgi:DNA-binding transcriptional regulator WhiA
VTATIGNFYIYNYGGMESNYINFHIQDYSGQTSVVYVARNSEAGRRIYQLLKDGGEHHITIKVSKDKTSNKTGELLLVTKLLADSWYYQEE